MSIKLHYTLFFFFCALHFLSAQPSAVFAETFTVETTDAQKFKVYLDTADEYLYRDPKITEYSMQKCEEIINRGVDLSDSIMFEYHVGEIYYEHSQAKPLAAYQIVAETEVNFRDADLTVNQKGSFDYIKGFTYMSVGDLEAAQKSYYEGLETAKMEKDTSSMVSCLYSLGQLYSDEGNNEEALKYFGQLADLAKTVELRASTEVLIYMEYGETYVELKQFDKALKAYDTALRLAKERDMQVLKSEILINKGRVFLKQENLTAAQGIYDVLKTIGSEVTDATLLKDAQKFDAELFTAKKQYKKALGIYKDLLEKTQKDDYYNLKVIYQKSHELSKKMKDFATAYEYFEVYDSIQTLENQDKKRQQTAYLKVKFDTEQKEKENALLNAEILKNQSQRKQLFYWLILFGLILIFMINAFYQKQRYSKTLEAEVKGRTKNLRTSNALLNQSNEELSEFNRLLSHDLKEPLRNIVGFSQLASRETKEDKVREYLAYVVEAGIQLGKLIDDVIFYRNIDSLDPEKKTLIRFDDLLQVVLTQLKQEYPEKKLLLQHSENISLYGVREILSPVIRIVLENAFKYSQGDQVKIDIRYTQKRNTHHFVISDNGIGVAPAFRDKIFKMFRRLNNRKLSGSGIGLSTAKRLLERVGGKISLVKSEEGVGSTFLVEVPVEGV